MATITQRLAFLVSANADQAIKAFDKTAATAEKQMGKAGKSIDKLGASMTKFGAAGLAAAGTLGGGLFKLAQGAIDDQKAQALLADQLRKSTGATDAQIKKIEEMIDATARATGVADDQLRPAMGNLVRAFGDAEKASTVLTTALNISQATGRDLETVTIALGRAANGNVGALSRLGIPLDENVKKSKDFDAALKALNAQFGGAAAAAADTYAGKLARARVAVSEAGEQIGAAFIPVVEKSVTALAGTINKLGEVDKATGGAIGKFAAFGTVGLGVVSALSLVAGQAIKLRDRFTTLGADGERSLTKLGSAAKYASISISAIALSEGVFAVMNEINDSSQKLDQSLQDLNRAIAAVDTTQMLSSFRKLVKEQDNVRSLSNVFTDFGKEIKIVGGESSRDIEYIDRAFKKLLQESGPKAAQALLDAWREQNKTLDTASNQYKDNTMLIERYQSRVDSLTGSQQALNKINEQAALPLAELKSQYRSLSDAILRNEERVRDSKIAELNEKQAKRIADEQDRQAKAAAEYAKKVDELASKLETKLAKALSNAEENAANANKAFSDYQKTIAGSVTGVVSFGEAQATAEANTKALADAKQAEVDAQIELNKALTAKDADPEKIAEARQKLADATKAVTDAEKAPLTFGDALKGQVTTATDFKSNLQKVLDLGGDQALIDQLTAAGADAGNAIIKGILASSDPKAKVDELDQTLANVAALGDAIGKASAEKFYGEGVKLANELLRGVSEQLSGINVDKVKGGKNAIKNLKKLDKNLKNTPVDTSLGLILGAQVPSLADGGIVPARPGGTLVRVGEGGQDEAVLPLPRMQGGDTINLYVTAGMGADGTQIGRQIVDELVAYQRRVGALPIKVAG